MSTCFIGTKTRTSLSHQSRTRCELSTDRPTKRSIHWLFGAFVLLLVDLSRVYGATPVESTKLQVDTGILRNAVPCVRRRRRTLLAKSSSLLRVAVGQAAGSWLWLAARKAGGSGMTTLQKTIFGAT